ncbi:cytochrome P450 [Rhodocollybia butyracea]|uniref:Cytochrome P450 n=1 Tax=Rhodocollybia butyracea TaxID=206335 RepID=A0A9P5PLZ2_9AGAR|nr:cytochrome P450 [Rhodocollybia butyracea]
MEGSKCRTCFSSSSSYSCQSNQPNYVTHLLQTLFVVLLSASLWSIFRRHRKVQGVPSISKLPGPQSQSWWQGNLTQVFDVNGWEFHRKLAEYGPTVGLNGTLGHKQFYTSDVKAMNHILVKNPSVFPPLRHNEGLGEALLGKGLLTTDGEHHRKQRKMLNPVFSIAYMRSIMPTFYDVVDQLQNALHQRVQDGPREIDLLGWMSRTALELIGQSGFGYSFDNMLDDVPKHKYTVVMKELAPAIGRLRFAMGYIFPLVLGIVRSTNVRIFLMNAAPWKTLHSVRDMSEYMYEVSLGVYEAKKRALEEGDEAMANQIGRGKDLLSILMKDNMNADNEDKLDEEEVIAQMSTFIFAAMDTTSNGMSRILHLLSSHQDAQDKIRQEIIQARSQHQGNRLSYDELVALPYLDAVCRETLRLHPPVPVLLRKCSEDVVVPFSQPVQGTDGTEITEVFLPKSTPVLISILNSNRSAELWGPDANEWKPERWLSPLPETITGSKVPGVYAHLMTFSGGSRSCIGFKFSQLEMKVVISMLVENFKFSLPQKKDVLWRMSGVVSPVVEGGDGHPRLPLVMELMKP